MPSGPVIGLGSMPSTVQPCAFNPAFGLGAHALVDRRIAHHAALAHLLAPRLELRLDERDQLRARLRQLQRRFEHLGEPDEARVANDDVDRLRE